MFGVAIGSKPHLAFLNRRVRCPFGTPFQADRLVGHHRKIFKFVRAVEREMPSSTSVRRTGSDVCSTSRMISSSQRSDT
jgi:hypothetical protein